MPELIDDGETGLLVASADDAVEAVDRVGSIDRAACRRAIEARFSVEAMADRYIALYREILAQPDIPIAAILPEDRVITRGTQAYANAKA